jgi:hypothetical protein
VRPVSAQVPAGDAAGDYLFPGMLRPAATLATGSPYVAITDLALGFGPHAALGVLAGVTPRVAGIGAHPRAALRFDPSWRAFVRAPMLYYPETNGASAWVLTRPSLVLERAVPGGLRVYGGGGALYAACMAELLGERNAPEHADHPQGPGHGRTLADGSAAPMEVLFWTLNLGASLRMARNIDGFLDLASVMDGAQLAGSEWTDFGGPPIMAVLGATARF